MEPGTNWTPLDIAVIGGGVGGTAASIALRRAGNKVTVYERADFAGEVGASISCAANGMKWLHEWQVNIEKGDGVYLKQLINRDWKTGEPVSVVDLSDYEEKWGQASLMGRKPAWMMKLHESPLTFRPLVPYSHTICFIGKVSIMEGRISAPWPRSCPDSVCGQTPTHGSLLTLRPWNSTDMHKMLMDCALSKEGDGVPVKLVVNHKCEDIDTNSGTVVFTDGSSVKHDVIIGSDGIGSAIRKLIGIQVEKRPAESSCLHANVTSEEAVALGLPSYGEMNSAIEYWGGHGSLNKIVLSPCRNSSLLSYYCFFPREKGDYSRQTWTSEDRPVGELLSPYPDLDPEVYGHLKIGQEIRPWRLWVHEPYSHWQKGLACIMGDAAHPMMPDQSQGACTALEDAAALGLLFSKDFYAGSVEETLKLYEKVRMPRATKVQAASARARENIHERIGFSDNTDNKLYAVNDESSKLTIAEMNSYDMRADILSKWPVSAQTSVTTNGR